MLFSSNSGNFFSRSFVKFDSESVFSGAILFFVSVSLIDVISFSFFKNVVSLTLHS